MTRKVSLGWWLTAFVFWAAFLLVLEPGNLSKASALGYQLSFGREFTRIVCAALIGTAAMPVVLFLDRRYPVTSLRDHRNALWLLLGLLALAGVMNLVSSVFAAWGFERRWLPSGGAIRRQLVANWTLLAFALIGLSALVRVVRFSRERAEQGQSRELGSGALREVIVRSGTHTLRVDLAAVDWIEAQGNYVALHVGSRTHLLRQTLKTFAAQLDDARFVRIHRSRVVPFDRIKSLRSEVDGEATLLLTTGQELRVSKTHRRAVRARWGASA
jgi:uncharacterized membrane protein